MAKQHQEALQGETAAWKAKLQSHTDKVASNLRSISAKRTRVDKAADILNLQKAGTAHHLNADLLSRHVHQDQLGSTKVELGSLLAAVQGSLADLRIEVAAAKRLSSNASTIMTMSPARKQATPKKTAISMVSEEQATTADNYMPIAAGHQPHANYQVQPVYRGRDSHSLHTHAPGLLSHPRTHGFGSMITSGLPHDRTAPEPVSPHAFQQSLTIPAFYPGDVNSGLLAHEPGLPTADNIIKVLDTRINEFASRLEKKIERSLSANAKPQFAPGNHAPTGNAHTAARDTNESLLLLSINRAEAAEKSTMQLSQQVVAMEKSHNNVVAEWERRVNDLQESHRQQLDKLGHVDKALDRINKQQADQVNELVSAEQLRALEQRVVSAEAANARMVSEMEEQQKLLLALSSAVQKAGIARNSGTSAVTPSVDDSTFKRLEARMSDMESRVSNLNAALLANKTYEMSRDVDGAGTQQDDAIQARLEVLEQRLEQQQQLLASKDEVVKELAAATADKEAMLTRLTAAEGLVFELAKYVESAARPNIEQTTAAVGNLSTQLSELGKHQSELADKLSSLASGANDKACEMAQEATAQIQEMKDQLSTIQRDLQAIQHASDAMWERLHKNMKEEVGIAAEDACNAAVQPIATHLDEVLERVQVVHDTVQAEAESDKVTLEDVRLHTQHLSELDTQYHDMQQQLQSIGTVLSELKQKDAEQSSSIDLDLATITTAANESQPACTDRGMAISQYDQVAGEVSSLKQSVTAMQARLTAEWFVSLELEQLKADKPLTAHVRDTQVAVQALQSTVSQIHDELQSGLATTSTQLQSELLKTSSQLQSELAITSSQLQSLQGTQTEAHKTLCDKQNELRDQLDTFSQKLQNQQQATEMSLAGSKQAENQMTQELGALSSLKGQLSQLEEKLQAMQARQTSMVAQADVTAQVEAVKRQLLDHLNELQEEFPRLLDVMLHTHAEDTAKLDSFVAVQQTIIKDVQALQESVEQHEQHLVDSLQDLGRIDGSTKHAVVMLQRAREPHSTPHDLSHSVSTASLDKTDMFFQHPHKSRFVSGMSNSTMHNSATSAAIDTREVMGNPDCTVGPVPAVDIREYTSQRGLTHDAVCPTVEVTALSRVIPNDSECAGSHCTKDVQGVDAAVPACSATMQASGKDIATPTQHQQSPHEADATSPQPENTPGSPQSPDFGLPHSYGEQSFLSEPDEHEVYGVQPPDSPQGGLHGTTNSSSVWDHVVSVPHDDEDEDYPHDKYDDHGSTADVPLAATNSWDSMDRHVGESIKPAPETASKPSNSVPDSVPPIVKTEQRPEGTVVKSPAQAAAALNEEPVTPKDCKPEQQQQQSQTQPTAGTVQPVQSTPPLPAASNAKPVSSLAVGSQLQQPVHNNDGCAVVERGCTVVERLPSVNAQTDSVKTMTETVCGDLHANTKPQTADVALLQRQPSQVGKDNVLHGTSHGGAANHIQGSNPPNSVGNAPNVATVAPALHRQHSLDALAASNELEKNDSTSDLRRTNSIGGVSVSSDRQRFRRFSCGSAGGAQGILQTHTSGGGNRNRQTEDSIELEVVDDELGDFLVDDDELIFEQHFDHGESKSAGVNGDNNNKPQSTENQPSADGSSNLSSSGWLHISNEASKLAAGLLSGSREIRMSQAGHQPVSQAGSSMATTVTAPVAQTAATDVNVTQSASSTHDVHSKHVPVVASGSLHTTSSPGVDKQGAQAQQQQQQQQQQQSKPIAPGNEVALQQTHLATQTTVQTAKAVLATSQAQGNEPLCNTQPVNSLQGSFAQPAASKPIVHDTETVTPAPTTVLEKNVAVQAHEVKGNTDARLQGSLMYQESFDDGGSSGSDAGFANSHNARGCIGLTGILHSDVSDDEVEVFTKAAHQQEPTSSQPATSVRGPVAAHGVHKTPLGGTTTSTHIEQQGSNRKAAGNTLPDAQHPSQPAISHIGGRAGLGDESMSLDPETEEEDIVFSDDDEHGLPMFANDDPASNAQPSSQLHASSQLPATVSKVAAHHSHGVVLDEDIDEDPVTSGLGLGANTGLQSRPSLTSTTPRAGGKPPLPPQLTSTTIPQQQGATTNAQIAQTSAVQAQGTTGSALTAASLGLLDSIHTPPLRRSASASELSLPDSSGYTPSSMVRTAGRRRAGRKVLTKGCDDGTASQPDLARCSMDSWEGSEYSMEGSLASLSGVAPGGVRPATTMQTRLQFLGTSRKRVSFSEYSEEWELPLSPQGPGMAANEDDAGSVDTIDEEQLHDFQNDGVSKTELSYDNVIPPGSSPQDSPQTGTAADHHGRRNNPNAAQPTSKNTSNANQQTTLQLGRQKDTSHATSSLHGTSQAVNAANNVISPTKVFDEVPLGRRVRPGMHAGRVSDAMAFKIKIFTADRLNAGLGATDVHMEVLGPSWVISQALPKEKGAFQRGCVDRFAAMIPQGDSSDILAIKLWHEGGNNMTAIGRGRWCLARVEIENKMRGIRYVFSNADHDGWLSKGRRHAVVMKPTIERIDEIEDLRVIEQEMNSQLQANTLLNSNERQGIVSRLAKVGQMIAQLAGGGH